MRNSVARVRVLMSHLCFTSTHVIAFPADCLFNLPLQCMGTAVSGEQPIISRDLISRRHSICLFARVERILMPRYQMCRPPGFCLHKKSSSLPQYFFSHPSDSSSLQATSVHSNIQHLVPQLLLHSIIEQHSAFTASPT